MKGEKRQSAVERRDQEMCVDIEGTLNRRDPEKKKRAVFSRS
jgi:hypothetical protein